MPALKPPEVAYAAAVQLARERLGAMRAIKLGTWDSDTLAGDARRRLLPFVRRYRPDYLTAPHHVVISDALEDVEAGRRKRVIFVLPPRHGKSELASIHFPPWYLGRNPDKRIIGASYAAALAYRFSRRARNLIGDPRWPFPTHTAGDLSNVQAWDIADHRGGYYSAGVGGGIAGMGADILLIDDPVRSAADADSLVYRDRAWEWFRQDATTRLEPDGAIILIGTRWHEDDLIGRALAMPDEQWDLFHFPAIDDDGCALWPERWPVDKLEERRSAMGERAFTALYQGRPAPPEGTILKREWWRSYQEPLNPFSWLLQSWDTANKTGQENDYSVCVTMGLMGQVMVVLDVWRDRVPFPLLRRAVRDLYHQWQPDEIIIEDKSSGMSLIQDLIDPGEVDLSQIQPWDRLPSDIPLPIVPFNPGVRDKIQRANAASPYLEGGRQFLPPQASWRERFVEELAAFPTGQHDDQVDAYSQATLRLVERLGLFTQVDPALAASFVGLPR